MAGPALVLCSFLISGGLALAVASVTGPASADASEQVRGQPVEAVLLRARDVDGATLLDALELRSPQRELSIPPWPSDARTRYALFAVATIEQVGESLTVTVVLSDGRAYYRTLPSSPTGAPREAASTVANLLAAIEEDELPPDEEDVPLPPEQEPDPQAEVKPEPPTEVKPEPPTEVKPKPKPETPPAELEAIGAGTIGIAVGPPDPAGFVGGGGGLGLELRLPAAAVISLAVRSHWHRVDGLTVGRTRISVGGGYAWRRGRFELRSVVGLDVEPWTVRREGVRQPVAYPDGQEREFGVQLGGHLRLVPSLRVPLGETVALRVGPRIELSGSALAQDAGVARLLVPSSDGGTPSVATRVGGLELMVGLELGVAWSLPRRR